MFLNPKIILIVIMMKIPQKNELELMITHTIGLHLLTGTMILLKQKSSSKQFGIKLG